MNELITFITSQRLLTLATQDNSWPWISNVFYGFEDWFFYFVSWMDALHSQQIVANSTIAFSTTWFNLDDHTDRKSIQWVGECVKADTLKDITIGIRLHNTYFPQFAERITVDRLLADPNRAVWIIKPVSIKFWNDGLYGINWTKTFEF